MAKKNKNKKNKISTAPDYDGEGRNKSLLGKNAIFTPEVIDDIHIKAQLGRYRMRGMALMKKIPTFDDLVFLPGTLTNPSLPYYSEPRLIIVSDPQVDAQAITEATNAGVPVIGIANTDNVTSKLDLVIPANNRGRKALATIYWLLAKEILGDSKAMKYEIEDFETKTVDVEEEL